MTLHDKIKDLTYKKEKLLEERTAIKQVREKFLCCSRNDVLRKIDEEINKIKYEITKLSLLRNFENDNFDVSKDNWYIVLREPELRAIVEKQIEFALAFAGDDPNVDITDHMIKKFLSSYKTFKRNKNV